MKKSVSDIIKETFYQLSTKWNDYMSACALQMIFSAIFVLFLPPFGLVLGCFVYTVTIIGLYKYIAKNLQNNSANAEEIFSVRKKFFNLITTKIIKYLHILFWSIFLFVPGLIVWLDYSLSDFILSENPNKDSFETLNLSRSMTYGNKLKIFTMCLMYVLLFLIIFMFASSSILITKMFTDVPTSVVVTSLSIICSVLYLFVLLPFIKVSQTILYLDIKKHYKEKNFKKEEPMLEKVEKNIKLTAEKIEEGTKSAAKKVKKTVQIAQNNVKETAKKLDKNVKKGARDVREKVNENIEAAKEFFAGNKKRTKSKPTAKKSKIT